MRNGSPGDLSPLPMTITPLLPPGFPSAIISAWLLLHPRVRRRPRLPFSVPIPFPPFPLSVPVLVILAVLLPPPVIPLAAPAPIPVRVTILITSWTTIPVSVPGVGTVVPVPASSAMPSIWAVSTSVLGAIGLVLNPVQCVLQARYKDLAAIVAGNFALLDQRDRGHKSLNGRGKLAVGSILDCSGDGGTGNCSVSAHYFLELGLRETVGDLMERHSHRSSRWEEGWVDMSARNRRRSSRRETWWRSLERGSMYHGRGACGGQAKRGPSVHWRRRSSDRRRQSHGRARAYVWWGTYWWRPVDRSP